jgi:integrase/recombinase XerC
MDDQLPPTSDRLIEQHQLYLVQRNMRPSTIYQRGRVLARLDRQIAPIGLLEVDGDTITSALDARPGRDGSGLTPATRAGELAHLASFYEWALTARLTSFDPTTTIPRPRLTRRIPRPMPDDDMVRAIDQAPDLRIRTILMLAAYGGLRASEIAQLRGEHLLLRQDPMIMIIEVSKGGSPSTAVVSPILAELLRQLPPRGHLVTRRDGRPGPNAGYTISHIANSYLHSIGIDHTLHTLRHWFGTWLYRSSGRCLRTTQEGMRHLSQASTVGYTFVSPGDVAAAVAAMPTPAQMHERTAA